MEKEYTVKLVYRVWYISADGNEQEAFFTDKDTASAFTMLTGGFMNNWTREMKIGY